MESCHLVPGSNEELSTLVPEENEIEQDYSNVPEDGKNTLENKGFFFFLIVSSIIKCLPQILFPNYYP